MTIVKKTVRSTDPVRGERSDKNQYPNGGTDGSRKTRGTHQIKNVQGTAPYEWDESTNESKDA